MPFNKAKPAQAYFKLGCYGKQGSGKTFTSLLFAEYLAKREGKRVAYIDTEHGTDFYATAIPDRKIHPEAFDFDAIYTRSIMEAVDEVEQLDPRVYGAVVIDSITHLWTAAIESYTGKRMSNGGIPIQGWGPIKKPYKKLMQLYLDGQWHAILCGREGVVMENNDDGEPEVVGTKMKAEGETGYESHFLFRFRPNWLEGGGQQVAAFVEKDRSGILQNKTIIEPNATHIEPILKYLTAQSQGAVGTVEDAAEKDAAAIEAQEHRAKEERKTLFEQIRSALKAANSLNDLKTAWSLTNGKKTKLGDDFYQQLEGIKEGRKVEFLEAA